MGTRRPNTYVCFVCGALEMYVVVLSSSSSSRSSGIILEVVVVVIVRLQGI